MQTVSKKLLATAAAGAVALTAAAPAQAQYRDYDRDDGIDAGEVIAGAVVLGGLAAVLGGIGNDDRYYDRRYRDRNYRYDNRYRRGNSRSAVAQCVNAAERDARRYGYRAANVTDIRDVDRTRYGYKVKGRIVVDGQRGYGRYDRYSRYDRYDRRYDRRDYDRGKFECRVEGNRVTYLDFDNIRGLR